MFAGIHEQSPVCDDGGVSADKHTSEVGAGRSSVMS